MAKKDKRTKVPVTAHAGLHVQYIDKKLRSGFQNQHQPRIKKHCRKRA